MTAADMGSEMQRLTIAPGGFFLDPEGKGVCVGPGHRGCLCIRTGYIYSLHACVAFLLHMHAASDIYHSNSSEEQPCYM